MQQNNEIVTQVAATDTATSSMLGLEKKAGKYLLTGLHSVKHRKDSGRSQWGFLRPSTKRFVDGVRKQHLLRSVPITLQLKELTFKSFKVHMQGEDISI